MSYSFYIRHKIKVFFKHLFSKNWKKICKDIIIFFRKSLFEQNLLKSLAKSLTNNFSYSTILLFLSGVIFFAVFFCINFFFDIYVVEGDSMYPAYVNGDVVLLENYSPTFANFAETLKRGDIIVFKDVRNPVTATTTASTTKKIVPNLIKRVMGLPGENIYVDGENVKIVKAGTNYSVDKDYNLQTDYGHIKWETTFLGPLDYYVLGDNRRKSRDSRDFGTVQPSEMLGRVIYKFK